jgi:hypothetical protein
MEREYRLGRTLSFSQSDSTTIEHSYIPKPEVVIHFLENRL